MPIATIAAKAAGNNAVNPTIEKYPATVETASADKRSKAIKSI